MAIGTLPEQTAKRILNDWVVECRRKNSSRKVELNDVSNWVEKCPEISKTCPTLDSPDGFFLLFCLGSLLSFGGGNYKARVTEIKNKYNALVSRKFDKDNDGWNISQERKTRFTSIDTNLKDLSKKFSSEKFLKEWWKTKKDLTKGDLEKAAELMIREIHGWTYQPNRLEKRALFTVKVFWIPRELHANGIWEDFPVEYCCVPDRYVKDVLFEIYGASLYKKMFGVRYGDPAFNLEASILMSKKVRELVSMNKVDGYFPYDLPFFRSGKK